MSVDLYSPWREPSSVSARHVGRAAELDAILRNAGVFAGGGSPLPMYVFGPRGVGKSHLLTMARERLSELESEGLQVVWVPEDIPEERSAESLLARMQIGVRPRRWTRWRGEPETATATGSMASGRRVVLFEGLDRQLHALGSGGRHALRRMLDERDDMWLVGTGVSLSSPFTGREEAFYGAFDLRPLEPLDDAEAAALLDAVVGHGIEVAHAHWQSRRNTLVALAGGNARALVALGAACLRHPEGWASQQLHDVLRDFTAHYQMRFRDLSPQHQQMVALLSESPRELTPSDLAQELGSSTSQMSVQAGRLVDDGVLRQRTSEERDKRQTWYRLAEPLFRFWLEYRNTSWDQTRAGWLGRLLETLMTPQELADAWWTHPDHDIWDAAGRMLSPDQTNEAWRRLYDQARDPEALPELIRRAASLRSKGNATALVPGFVLQVLQADRGVLLSDELRDALAKEPRYRDVAALVDFERAARADGGSLREAFMALVERLAEHHADGDGSTSLLDMQPLLMGCVTVLSRQRRGGPWKLRDAERRRLAAVPVLRAYFAEHGRLATHGPLLDPEDILGALAAVESTEPSPRMRTAPLLDAGALILTGVVRRSPALLSLAADSFDASSSWAFAPCPLPARVQPGTAADAVMAAARRAGTSGQVLVTWAASYATLSDTLLHGVLADLSATAPPDELGDQSEIALASLAMHARDRFDRLCRALGEDWREVCERAALLCDQLSEADHGQLHPELEYLRRAFSDDATT